jgi:hypothetical protein
MGLAAPAGMRVAPCFATTDAAEGSGSDKGQFVDAVQ